MKAIDEELVNLEVFIGKWINHGHVTETGEEIITSDIYEWLPGKRFVLHTAYGLVGERGGGGVELIGYDPKKKAFVSTFFTDLHVAREGDRVHGDLHRRRPRPDGPPCPAEQPRRLGAVHGGGAHESNRLIKTQENMIMHTVTSKREFCDGLPRVGSAWQRPELGRPPGIGGYVTQVDAELPQVAFGIGDDRLT
jgi:hypothetical protein